MTQCVSDNLRKDLFALKDLKYQQFHSKLIPNINSELVIGVRTPALRKYAKQFFKTPEAAIFMQELPHKY